jgi:hypothetical protein
MDQSVSFSIQLSVPSPGIHGQQVGHGALDGGGVFERCEADAQGAGWSAARHLSYMQVMDRHIRECDN